MRVHVHASRGRRGPLARSRRHQLAARRVQANLVRWFVDFIGWLGPERLARAMRAPIRRRLLLTAVFRTMPRVVSRRALEREECVIAWRLTGRQDGHADVRQLVIEDGGAFVLGGDVRTPDLELTLDGADFIELATGQGRATALFVRGRIEVGGDPWLAMRLERMLRTPRPSRES